MGPLSHSRHFRIPPGHQGTLEGFVVPTPSLLSLCPSQLFENKSLPNAYMWKQLGLLCSDSRMLIFEQFSHWNSISKNPRFCFKKKKNLIANLWSRRCKTSIILNFWHFLHATQLDYMHALYTDELSFMYCLISWNNLKLPLSKHGHEVFNCCSHNCIL